MSNVRSTDSRDWARDALRGVCNVIQPSFTADLRGLNEAGIRHDVRRNIELGFAGALLVSECATTNEEYLRFVEIAVDEARGRQILYFHGSFNTLQENIEMGQAAAARGADMCLLSYPPTFYPRTEAEVIEHTLEFCRQVNLKVMLFPVPLWDFERLHPASISIPALTHIVEQAPNVVAIKAEGGMPSLVGFAHVWHSLGEKVVVSMPILQQAIPLSTLIPLQLIATSNTEYYGRTAPELLRQIHAGKTDEALESFWQIMPALRAAASAAAVPNANSVHRMAWKYQAWLNGYNGGPMRMPTMRLTNKQMRALRGALVESGIPTTTDSDEAFFTGRVGA